MRKLLLLLIIPLLFACEEDGFKVKPGAQFRIEPVISSKQSAPAQEEDTIHLSHLEIVKQAVCIVMYYFDTQTETYQVGRGGFSSKDTVSAIPALYKMPTKLLPLMVLLWKGT